MALSNYDELQSAIVDFCTEVTEADPITTFISLAEGDVFPLLKHYLMETTVTLSTTNNAVELPEDAQDIRKIVVDGIVAKQVSIYGGELRGTQIGYYQSGNSIVFVPSIDTPRAVELTYYASPAALSEDNPSNWLLRKFPAVYLQACLVRAFHWRGNDPASAREKALLQEALALVNLDHQKRTSSGNTFILDGGNPYVA